MTTSFTPNSAWVARLMNFAPDFLHEHPALSTLSDRALILHGSTTFGVIDDHSDLDVWIIVPSESVAEFDSLSPTRFIEFKLAGKKGHFNLMSIVEMTERVNRCDFPVIAEFRYAIILDDPNLLTEALFSLANQPMRDDVRLAWFRYHYVEMRGEHRACDNPIERGHAVALLLAFGKTIEHALRAACVLDGEPYHYSKWLAPMARKAPTGERVAALVEEAIDLLGRGQLRVGGPESQHALSQKLREIRAVLISEARARGIDDRWLIDWWLYIDSARTGIRDLRWQS